MVMNSEGENNTQKKEGYEDPEIEIKGRNYVERRRVRRRGQIVCVARHERRSYPFNDNQPPSVTGRFQEKDGQYTLHINHAGSFIEAVISWIFSGNRDSEVEFERWQAQNRRPILFLWGKLQDDDSFILIPEPGQEMYDFALGEKKDASLIFSFRLSGSRRNNTLKLREWIAGQKEEDGKIYELNPNEPEAGKFTPTYMKDYLNNLPDDIKREYSKVIRMYEWAPLTTKFYRWLKSRLLQKSRYRVSGSREIKEESIENIIREYAGVSKGSRVQDKIERQKIVFKLELYFINAVFPTRGSSAWHRDDLVLAQFFARLILEQNKLLIDRTVRSYMDWIRIIVNQYWIDNRRGLSAIQRYLDVQPDNDSDPKYQYEIELELRGIRGGKLFGGGYFEGTIKISKISKKGNTVEEFQRTYGAWLIVLQRESGISLSYSANGTAESNNNWQMSDFEGPYSIWSIEGVGQLIEVNGTKHYPRLQFFVPPKPARGISAFRAWGGIYYPHRLPPAEPKKDDGPYVKVVESSELVKSDGSIHFRCGSAKLSNSAIKRIGFFCARELPSFLMPDSLLWVVGHADRLDTEERNYELSQLRAENTLNVIEGILGDKLRANFVYATGWGEEEAQRDKIPDPSKTGRYDPIAQQPYRRVDIILNGRLLVRLYGE
jgi:outer membrane protein OmpA-like peptidoglycan-associated protein